PAFFLAEPQTPHCHTLSLHDALPISLDVAEPEGGHLEDDRRQVGALDLGFGELGAALEVVFVVEPDADARRDAAAATGPLVRGGLGDRLDRQPLHLGAVAVAGDAGGA